MNHRTLHQDVSDGLNIVKGAQGNVPSSFINSPRVNFWTSFFLGAATRERHRISESHLGHNPQEPSAEEQLTHDCGKVLEAARDETMSRRAVERAERKKSSRDKPKGVLVVFPATSRACAGLLDPVRDEGLLGTSQSRRSR
jgi:hypothetical protein